jgi:uncharacterized protein (TIGR03000 family)
MVVAAWASGGGRAEAWHPNHRGPWPATAAFPTANPPGWYTNTYWFAWNYPWYAYYNFSHGPYANWTEGGGYAGYSTVGWGHPVTRGVRLPEAGYTASSATATLTVELPEDAKLLFNGTAATGTGSVRTFAVPSLQPGVDYGYELTAELTVGGKVQTATKKVTVRAGEATKVTLFDSPK